MKFCKEKGQIQNSSFYFVLYLTLFLAATLLFYSDALCSTCGSTYYLVLSNTEGNLVAIFDEYDRQMTIAYDENNKISKVYNGDKIWCILDYYPNDMLRSVTDICGRKTDYKYDNDGNLTDIVFISGKTATLTYDTNGNLIKVASSDKVNTILSYTGNALDEITVNSEIDEISFNETILSTITKNVSRISVTQTLVADTTLNLLNMVVLIADTVGNKKIYVVDGDDKVIAYYEEENNKVVKAEKYDKKPYEKDNIKYAKVTSLHTKPYSSFTASDFTGGDYENTVLDEFNNPRTITTNERKLSDSTTQQSTVTYDYDNNHRCVKETAEITVKGLSDGNKT